jgi:hypothetical protein
LCRTREAKFAGTRTKRIASIKYVQTNKNIHFSPRNKSAAKIKQLQAIELARE